MSEKPKNKIGLLIFDFDGVLADSFDTFYPLMHNVMKHIGLSLTPNQYRDFFIDNVHQSIKNFINDENKYASAMKFRNSNYNKYYNEKSHRAKLFSGTTKFLEEISKDYVLTIASSGRIDNIKKLLEENGVINLFSEILANTAVSKEGMLKKIMDKFMAVPEKTIMITDTVGDLMVAKETRLKTAAVTWGFHSHKLLKSANPDFLVSDFKELRNVLMN